jgi:hypothetical protein
MKPYGVARAYQGTEATLNRTSCHGGRQRSHGKRKTRQLQRGLARAAAKRELAKDNT